MAVGVAEEEAARRHLAGQLHRAAGTQRQQAQRDLEAGVLAVAGRAGYPGHDDLDPLGLQAVAGGDQVSVGVRVGEGGRSPRRRPAGARRGRPSGSGPVSWSAASARCSASACWLRVRVTQLPRRRRVQAGGRGQRDDHRGHVAVAGRGQRDVRQVLRRDVHERGGVGRRRVGVEAVGAPAPAPYASPGPCGVPLPPRPGRAGWRRSGGSSLRRRCPPSARRASAATVRAQVRDGRGRGGAARRPVVRCPGRGGGDVFGERGQSVGGHRVRVR
ncbi:hypothetical protein SCALM49S_06350 [Streptomyces californicus]